MAYSSTTFTISLLLLTGFQVAVMAAPGSWNAKANHVYTDSVAEGQLSPPRRLRRCACFVQFSPETNKTEWYCTEDSDPRCRQLIIGDLTIVQEKALHQALESKVEEAVHQCVCYLDVKTEANILDFSCSNPQCYQLVAKTEEVASANNWPHFECQPTDRHPSDACCRCHNYHWECNILKQRCPLSSQRCPVERQVAVPGECCPICLQARHNTAQNYLAANTNQGSQQIDSTLDSLQSCECSVCKYTDSATGELGIRISRSHPECQCDFQITYPYDDLAICSPKERAMAMKAYSDKLAKELADATRRG